MLTITALSLAVQAPLSAEHAGRSYPLERLRADLASVLTEEEQQDAREIAERINEAVSIRREVIVTLRNDTAVTVATSSRVTARRYWVIVANPDGTEIRFRASMIATLQIR